MTNLRLLHKHLAFFLLILLVAMIIPASTYAQGQTVNRIAVQATDHISFYRVDDAGNFELLEDLTDSFSLVRYGVSEWQIPTREHIVASPDGQHIGFVAQRTVDPITSALFIFTVGEPGLKQADIPGVATLKWSPGSDAIALVPEELFLGGEYTSIDDIFLYDLAHDRLTQLTNLPGQKKRSGMWLPDNEHIAFAGLSVPCSTSCSGSTDNIYIIDRSNLSLTQLTDLGSQIPQGFTIPQFLCFADQLIWSTLEDRIYYQVTCIPGEATRDFLFSVSLAGDNRLEADLSSQFPQDEQVIIADFHPTELSSGIILVNPGEISEPDPNDLDGFKTHQAWRIYTLEQPSNPNLITTVVLPSTETFSDSALAPDEQNLAITGIHPGDPATGLVEVIDVQTGQSIISHATTQRVCDVEWQNNQNLIYKEIASGFCPFFGQQTGAFSLNIVTGAVEDITLGLSGAVWVLEPPDVAPLEITCDSTIPAADTAALIAAIEAANLSGVPTSLCLTNSVYSFDPASAADLFDEDGDNALPSVTGDITINGFGATIQRDPAATLDFRLLHVDEDGSLTLNDVTLSRDDPIRNHGRLIIDGETMGQP